MCIVPPMSRVASKQQPRRRRPLAKLIGERIKLVRDQNAISRTALASRSGVALTSLILLEQGRTSPLLSTLEKVARALNIRVAEILVEEPPPEPQTGGDRVIQRLLHRLRDRDPDYLLAVERMIKSFDAAIEAVMRSHSRQRTL